MNILVVGSGAREHAIVAALHRSPQKPRLYCYGMFVNPGINLITADYKVGDLTDCLGILEVAKEWMIELVIIGSEAPLEKGLSDKLWAINIPTIGPKQALAQIETSKLFARDLMHKYHIAGLPRYRSFHTLGNELGNFLNELGDGNYVIKANGLMGGKGVKVAGEQLLSHAAAIHFCKEVFDKKQTVIVEEKLIGQEFSYMCFTDGKHLVPMPLVQDHKRAYYGDKGPNTGGMGSYSDANHSLPFLINQEVSAAFAINQAILHALQQECQDNYVGILYGSFIATQHGVYVIEFNARFGDPEALNILPILESDLVTLCQAMIGGYLDTIDVKFAHKATVCKYAVPEGYPDEPEQGFAVDMSNVSSQEQLYLASVNQVNGQLLATASRTAAYVGIAATISDAEKQAEKEISKIRGALYHRQDIGTQQLIKQRVDDMIRIRSA